MQPTNTNSLSVIVTTNLPDLKLFKRGKVRDVYEFGNQLLIVATDRISAFDVVLPNGIPYKGKVLTQLSLFWFEFTKHIVPNHLITAEINEFPSETEQYRDILMGRSMLVKKSKVVEIECVVRGYLAGSAWKEYQATGTICGIKLPQGLRESSKLPEPIFTPATKASSGHDINISEKEMINIVGYDIGMQLKEKSIAIYTEALSYAESRGIIISDTKFEFGFVDDKLILIDEILTPDSSRFWPKDDYQPGRPQKSFDKQFVRDYLETLDWDKTAPGPPLPDDVVNKTSEKYLEAYQRLVGKPLAI
ncbi:MAG: phosphoribosylaminoimidazolesuccinocarboxamide synthase [bacterium]|nr:phosphoribosylaminoimidazolesuccinocarboxamide synthase [bacterium]